MIREKVKQYLSARRADRYEKELADKEAAYANWYRCHKRVLKQQMEEKDHTEGEKLSMEVVRYSHLRSFVLSGEKKPDIIIACDDDGNLSGRARTLISDFFAENPRINLVYGDEDRIDENGYARMYVFKGCRGFIRTIPLMMFDEHRVEDLDTDLEDHVADEWRYLCMSRPVTPLREVPKRQIISDPLNMFTKDY